MNVGDTARIIRGPWTGHTGPVTATFNGGWVTVRVANMERTFGSTEVDPLPLREHRIVTTIDFGDIHRHRCLDCHASRSGVQPPPPPCPGEAA